MSEKIYIQIGDKKQEAKGEVLEQILKDQTEYAETQRLIVDAQSAQADANDTAITHLPALG